MPKRLLERCGLDTIAEFLASAKERYRDGLALAEKGRRTAAIYLCGYAAEMTLKTAYFRILQFGATQAITKKDLQNAKNTAQGLGISWTGNFHDLLAWARLVVAIRSATPGLAYSNAAFGLTVANQAVTLQLLWNEVLRYRRNVAFPHEVVQVRAAVGWLLKNAARL